jgi:uncharacterized membrane-anchored protein YhcB (DUF1043 family)
VMQSVGNTTQEKQSKLESDLAMRQEELTVQRRALENSWGEIAELKKVVVELKAERDDLQNQIGLGT